MTPTWPFFTAGMVVGYPLGAAAFIEWGWPGVGIGAVAAVAGGLAGAFLRRRLDG